MMATTDTMGTLVHVEADENGHEVRITRHSTMGQTWFMVRPIDFPGQEAEGWYSEAEARRAARVILSAPPRERVRP